jgi:hypothetical protein
MPHFRKSKSMTEVEFEQNLHVYRQAIIETVARADPRFLWTTEAPELFARFDALSRNDLTQFRRLCARLLTDEQYEVRLGAIKLLRSCKIRDDILSEYLMQILVEQENLQEEALLALWRVGTRRVLPELLLFAEKGYSTALYMARRLIRTPEEIKLGIAIARKYIGAEDYPLREAALFLLQKYSSMETEAERVLTSVQKYGDELFIDALKEASPEIVLEPLKALRSTIEEKYAEYGDLSSTIQTLEQKATEERSNELEVN